MLSNRNSSLTWTPNDPEIDTEPEPSFSYFLSLGLMWRSTWSNGESELRIFGRGESPSEEQKRIWNGILPRFNEILDAAITSLTPPPQPMQTLVFLKRKEVSLDLRFIRLEFLDNGIYELLLETDLVVDEGEVGALVKMQRDRVLEVEWSV